ncbi:hypothetical protein CTAYLR_003282 [Chrysophaeum taylorii]|uniref:AMP-dependent synthetase/ligase domain-containing protein n=1 Tax=Chrysophaeum taylorii TaxID=2483200 RepID=A0AAD7UCP5_9STRA|nr:hypothetical protein CTAYLR_003282 [Chrysophaeum taylorii]
MAQAAMRTRITLANCATLHELGVKAGETFGQLNSIGTCVKGKWAWTSFAERAMKARQCANLLRSLGVRRGDRVAVISKNREEWVTAAYGSYGASAAFVPMYEQQTPQDWEYIIKDSGAKVLFVSREDLLDKAKRAANGAQVLCFDDGSFRAAIDGAGDGESSEAPTARDLATLIYTSGTTGKPKGVELTHHNLLWNSLTMKELALDNVERLPPRARPEKIRTLSILPWAHIFGQSCELHALTAMGAEMAVATEAITFLEEAATAKPTAIIAVPALYNRIKDGFDKTKAAAKPWRRRLADRAVALGDRKARKEKLGWIEHAEWAVLDRLILSKVRAKLGGRVCFLCSGGAAISTEVRNFLEAIRLPVSNGYGLTETSPVLTCEIMGDPNNRLPGSIGVPLPGVRIRTVDERGNDANGPGELVASGPGVMRGYWHRPDATESVLSTDADGTTWFKTGDQGVVKDGHVRIVGRIKEKYKLSNGKYVVPTPLEEAFSRSPFISQVFVYGDNKTHNVALVAPDWTALYEKICEKTSPIVALRPFDFGPRDKIEDFLESHDDQITDIIAAELRAHSVCKSYEFPAKWTVLTEGFTVARGMLTPKLSLRRNVVLKEHDSDLAALYDLLAADQDANQARDACATASSSSFEGAATTPLAPATSAEDEAKAEPKQQQQQQQQHHVSAKM